ncbi:MAG: hypothetical protein NTV49_07940, partial [Kiritimatiellaeota bacterium]|nr:hypothetical protein [Kiritimatiellota bacterium]
MHRIIHLAALLSCSAAWTAQDLPAAEQPKAGALDLRAITAQSTADNPQFTNKQAWPTLVGDEYFLKEKWRKARLLILALPGESERREGLKLDFTNPASWIDAATGQPASAIPDMDTDVVLPDSNQPYKVLDKEGEQGFACRHLTVGRNADFQIAGGGALSVFGNVWIRPPGNMFIYRTLRLVGSHATFFRQDWPEDGKLKKMHDTRAIVPYSVDNKTKREENLTNPWNDRSTRKVCHFMEHDKSEGKSTEVAGYVNVADEVCIKSGTFIVGRGSRFLTAGPSSMVVSKGAKVVLLDGAQCSHGQNQFVNDAGGNVDWGVADGAEVSGGTPDRPLRRDAYLGVGYDNWMNLPFLPAPDDKKGIPVLPSGAKIHYGYGGYSARISGSLIGYPAPGSAARLVVCWQRIAAGGAGEWGRRDEGLASMFPQLAPKITVWISGASKIESVRFDDLHRGGIVAPSLETFKSWKNISFGDACLSKDPNELVRGYEAEIAA